VAAQEFLMARKTVAAGTVGLHQGVSIEAGLLDSKDALSSFEGLFTDEFLR